MEKRFGAVFKEPRRYEPNYYQNAFALPELPVITSEDTGYIELFRWGLVPSWTRDRNAAGEIRTKTFNAKAETITEKPSFREPIRHKRCLVVSRGFYEWQNRVDGKIPFYIYLKGHRVFSYAGIYDRWQDKMTGQWENTFSIITTAANPLMENIHNLKKRMPVILDERDEKYWLDTSAPLDELLSLLKAYPESDMQAHTISKRITKRGLEKNTPEIIEPFTYPDMPLLNGVQ